MRRMRGCGSLPNLEWAIIGYGVISNPIKPKMMPAPLVDGLVEPDGIEAVHGVCERRKVNWDQVSSCIGRLTNHLIHQGSPSSLPRLLLSYNLQANFSDRRRRRPPTLQQTHQKPKFLSAPLIREPLHKNKEANSRHLRPPSFILASTPPPPPPAPRADGKPAGGQPHPVRDVPSPRTTRALYGPNHRYTQGGTRTNKPEDHRAVRRPRPRPRSPATT